MASLPRTIAINRQVSNRRNVPQGDIAQEFAQALFTKAVCHMRAIILQLAEVAGPRELWAKKLAAISDLKAKAQSP